MAFGKMSQRDSRVPRAHNLTALQLRNRSRCLPLQSWDHLREHKLFLNCWRLCRAIRFPNRLRCLCYALQLHNRPRLPLQLSDCLLEHKLFLNCLCPYCTLRLPNRLLCLLLHCSHCRTMQWPDCCCCRTMQWHRCQSMQWHRCRTMQWHRFWMIQWRIYATGLLHMFAATSHFRILT